MMTSSYAALLLMLSAQVIGTGLSGADSQQQQQVLQPHSPSQQQQQQHAIDENILKALELHADPVDALLSLHPDAAEELAEPRLLYVAGIAEPQWMTEGDKMRLRRQGKKFTDITDHEDFIREQEASVEGAKAHLPELSYQRYVKPLFAHVSPKRMHQVLEHFSGYYTRYFGSVTGEESAQWLHDEIAKIIKKAPFHTRISLEYFSHPFPQPSIIARFEPKVTNFSAPLTIVGAHQDSMNYLFPLLPAPGADDDGSGTVSILEAFRVLAGAGFVPLNGPVEFQWYAAEEGGNLGSLPIARYKKESGITIGAMLELDATAFIARNATEKIGAINAGSNPSLVKWLLKLAEEYSDLPAAAYDLPDNAGSDHMSFTRAGFPAVFASEGNPIVDGKFPGEYDPYMHTVKDRIDVDDETGHFSFDHMARFSELAIAFVVEQAGWDNQWR